MYTNIFKNINYNFFSFIWNARTCALTDSQATINMQSLD